jgi:hypothetical protein
MSAFSFEEKKRILLFIVKNSLDSKAMDQEVKWQELGSEMNRDWKEIRNAYFQWQKDDAHSITSKEKIQPEDLDNMNNVDNYNSTVCIHIFNSLNLQHKYYLFLKVLACKFIAAQCIMLLYCYLYVTNCSNIN